MQEEKANFYDQLITAVPRVQPLDIAYLQYLIDHPFKSFKDRISLETVEVEGEQKYYLRLTKLDTWPANVTFNFCIASRIPIEYPGFIKSWGKAVANGVHPGLAFLVVSRICWVGWGIPTKEPKGNNPWNWKLDTLQCPGGHFWFDSVANWENVLSGKMVAEKFAKPYKGKPNGCRPSNVIWGMESRDNKLVGMTLSELSNLYGLPMYEPGLDLKANVETFEIIIKNDDDDDDPDWLDDEEIIDVDILDEDFDD